MKKISICMGKGVDLQFNSDLPRTPFTDDLNEKLK